MIQYVPPKKTADICFVFKCKYNLLPINFIFIRILFDDFELSEINLVVYFAVIVCFMRMETIPKTKSNFCSTCYGCLKFCDEAIGSIPIYIYVTLLSLLGTICCKTFLVT